MRGESRTAAGHRHRRTSRRCPCRQVTENATQTVCECETLIINILTTGDDHPFRSFTDVHAPQSIDPGEQRECAAEAASLRDRYGNVYLSDTTHNAVRPVREGHALFQAVWCDSARELYDTAVCLRLLWIKADARCRDPHQMEDLYGSDATVLGLCVDEL